MSDIDKQINELSKLRAEFGRVGDDYRQAKIDVAIDELEECKAAKKDYKNAGVWEDYDNAES